MYETRLNGSTLAVGGCEEVLMVFLEAAINLPDYGELELYRDGNLLRRVEYYAVENHWSIE